MRSNKAEPVLLLLLLLYAVCMELQTLVPHYHRISLLYMYIRVGKAGLMCLCICNNYCYCIPAVSISKAWLSLATAMLPNVLIGDHHRVKPLIIVSMLLQAC